MFDKHLPITLSSDIQTKYSLKTAQEKPQTEEQLQNPLMSRDLQVTDYLGIFLLAITVIIVIGVIVKVFSD